MTVSVGPASTPGADGSDSARSPSQGRESAGGGSRVGRRLGSRAARGAAALIAMRVATWGFAFVQNVVVARAVVPRELGLYAMALAVVSLVGRAKQVGSTEKLVRDAEEDLPVSLAAATVVELVSAIVAMLVLAAGAALVPWRGADPRARLVIALLGVVLLQPIAELPVALFFRRLEFRRLALRRLATALAAVTATIGAAVAGAQVWSLVIGQAVAIVVGALLFWPSVEPRSGRRFDRDAIRAYLAFGVPLWGSGLLYALAERGSTLVASSVLGLATLGYIHLGQALTLRLGGANEAANSAIYPALRSFATQPAALREVLERTNRVFALVGIPIGVALGLFADVWVPLFFGNAWIPAVPFVSVYCLAWGFSAIGYPCYLAFQARGDTRTLFVFGSLSFVGRFVAIAGGVVLFGEPGMLVAVATSPAIAIGARSQMTRRMFPDFSLLRLSARPVAVGIVALVAVFSLSVLLPATGRLPIVRLLIFAVTAGVAAVALDRQTVHDAGAQIRGAFGRPRATGGSVTA
jgi:O-antigen/teichoic acid export membrane protein